MKKALCLTLALVMLLCLAFSLSGCKKKKKQHKYNNQTPITEEDAAANYDEQMTELNQLINQTFTNAIDSTEQSIYDQEGIKIVYKGLSSDDTEGIAIHLHLESSLDKVVNVKANQFAINGISVSEVFDCGIYPGRTTDYSIVVTRKMLNNAAIKDVHNITFSLTFTDQLDQHVLTTKKMNIDVPSSGPAQTVDRSGKVIYNQDGFNIILRRVNNVSTEESFWGGKVIVTVDNASGKDATMYFSSIALNGTLLGEDKTFDFEVGAGQTAIRELTFTKDELVACKAGAVDTLQFSVVAYGSDDSPLTSGSTEKGILY